MFSLHRLALGVIVRWTERHGAAGLARNAASASAQNGETGVGSARGVCDIVPSDLLFAHHGDTNKAANRDQGLGLGSLLRSSTTSAPAKPRASADVRNIFLILVGYDVI